MLNNSHYSLKFINSWKYSIGIRVTLNVISEEFSLLNYQVLGAFNAAHFTIEH